MELSVCLRGLRLGLNGLGGVPVGCAGVVFALVNEASRCLASIEVGFYL